jgi:predicted alternative tryptophan synthase beta-subunit
VCVSLGLDRKILLTEDQIPKDWYCILPDLPGPLQPLLDPKTRKPVDPRMLEAIFPRELVRQKVSGDRFVEITEEIQDVYRFWRPTPMYRACDLQERVRGTLTAPYPLGSSGISSTEGPPNGKQTRERERRNSICRT